MFTSVFSRRGRQVNVFIFCCCAMCAGPASGFAAKTAVSVDELLGKEPADIEVPAESPAPVVMGLRTMSVSASSSPSSSLSPQSSVNHFHFDPSSGSGSIALPLEIPPGRGGIRPEIALTYSPRGGNGPFGTGWGLDFGFIERSTKNGIPGFTDQDTFICSLGGGTAELVPVGGGRYRPRVEGEFFDIRRDGDTWVIRDRNGRTYFFGLSTLLNDESVERDGQRIFRWRLSEVRDSYGNFYFIRHLKNGGFDIYYTGEPGTDRDGVNTASQKFYARVTTEVEDAARNDVLLNFRSGMEQRINKRIKAVNVYAAGQLQKRYVFAYEASRRSGRSLLKQVTVYGADGAAALPTLTLAYEEGALEYHLAGVIDDPVTGDNLWSFRHRGGYDRGHDNYGGVPPAHMAPLSSPVIAKSWKKSGSWTQDDYGRIALSGIKDVGYYFATYFYVKKPVTILPSYQSNQWNPGFWLNGDYSKNQKSKWALKAGYNLLEYTDYHQHSSFSSKFLIKIADKVDLMNSAQLILPQLSGDFNGDGAMDVATFFPGSGKIKTALSTGGSFLPKEEWLCDIPKDSRPMLGDFNGDGRTDIAFFVPASGSVEVALSDGVRFVRSGVWISGFGVNAQVLAGDFNGDGFTDLVSVQVSGTQQTAGLSLNTRSGNFQTSAGVSRVVGEKDDTVFLADFNGDGLADFGAFNRSTGKWQARINPGTPDKDFFMFPNVTGFGKGKTMACADFNGDGLTDIGYFDTALGQIIYRASAGVKFSASRTLPLEFSLTSDDVQLQTGDFNADGITDFIVYNQIGNIEIAYSDGESADLLKQTDNGIGGVTAVSYALSSAFENGYLPFVFPVVTSVTRSNSRGNSVTSRYWYAGALWKPEEREFYGFQTVRVYDPDDHYTESTFLQDDFYFRGRLSRQAFYTNAQVLRAETIHQWNAEPVFSAQNPDIRFVYLKRTDQFEYDASAKGRRTAAEYFYGEPVQLGNVTKAVEYGEVDLKTGADILDDARWSEMTYLNRTDNEAWLIGYLQSKTAYCLGESGPTAKMVFAYDGAGGGLGKHGSLKETVRLNDGFSPERVTDRVDYDRYGNPVSTQTGEAKTDFYYDEEYHLVVLNVKDPIGQITHQSYYGIDGEPLNDGRGYQGLFGQVKSETAVNRAVVRYSYDKFGRLAAVIGPRDSLEYPGTRFQYDCFPDHLRVISEQRRYHGMDQVNRSAEFYDGLGRLIQAKALSGRPGTDRVSGETELDTHGRVHRAFIPRAAVLPIDQLEDAPAGLAHTMITYDEMGRPVTETFPDGTFTTREYWLGDTAVINQNGHKTKSYFDAFGNLVKKEEYRGADGRSALYRKSLFLLYASTRYFYNDRNQLTQVIDAKGNVTEITYDRLGRKIAMADPDMGYQQYGYDEAGNLIWQTDAAGRRIDFQYDRLNRLVYKTDGGDISVNYQYKIQNITSRVHFCDSNADGRLCMIRYGAQPDRNYVKFFYDDLGREVRSIKAIDGTVYYIGRRYDALDQVIMVVYPDGSAVYYHYDPAGRLEKISSEPSESDPALTPNDLIITRQTPERGFFNRVMRFCARWFESVVLGVGEAHADETQDRKDYVSEIEYNVMGQTVRIVYGTGTVKQYFYDDVNFRLERIYTVNRHGTVIQDLNYQYDAVGNVIGITDQANSASQKFQYDHLGRLTRAEGTNSYGVQVFRYDEIGNIISKDGRTYRYADAGSRIDGTRAGPHALTGIGNSAVFLYDENGNMVNVVSNDRNFIYQFDTENRLKFVFKGRSPLSAVYYDGDGGRTKKIVYGAVSAAARPVLAYPELLQDGAGEQDLVTHYVGSLYEVDNFQDMKHIYLGSERVLSIRNGEAQYAHTDHLGSVNIMEDADGNVREITEYQPFGSFSRRSQIQDGGQDGGQEGGYYFTQQMLDAETGLYYYGARYYDPALGRFISADPTVMHPFDPQDLNRYAYCRNNPVNMVDPSGYGWFSDFIGDFTQFLGDAIAVMSAPFTFMATGGNYYATEQVYNFYHNDFSRYALPAASAAVSIALTGSPIPGMAAMSSFAILNTGAGRQVVRNVGEEFFDDVLGMRPKTARIWSAVALNTMMSLGIERGLSHLTKSSLTMDPNRISDSDFQKAQQFPYASDEFQYGPSAKITNNDIIDWDKGYYGLYDNGEFVGGVGKRTLTIPGLQQIGANHVGANIAGASDGILPAWSYATLGGTCHQASNLTMLSAGYSNTILGFSQIGNWDMYVTTAVYGNYGGQLPSRIISGVQAHDD